MEQLSKKEEKRINGILTYIARGFSYRATANIYKITAERVRQIIIESRKYPQFNNLNVEIDNTKRYLHRKLIK
jgi:hypothetical protein